MSRGYFTYLVQGKSVAVEEQVERMVNELEHRLFDLVVEVCKIKKKTQQQFEYLVEMMLGDGPD